MIFYFVFVRFPRAHGKSTKLVQMKSSMTFIRGDKYKERMVIWKKNGGGNSS